MKAESMKEALKRMAELSCLALSAEEFALLEKDLEEILAFARGLPMTSAVEDSCEALSVALSALRSDEKEACFPRELLLTQAPAKDESYVIVPVMGKESGQ
jgi:aspartyl/glutamyl-tRNA(Asn/Gln) amidotransferase C subunit